MAPSRIALTQRGHGDSSRPAGGYGFADMAHDVCAFMDAVQLPSAVIVGHSMGSMVAQRFAIDHPTRVLGLVLMATFRTLHRHAGAEELWQSTVSTLSDPVDPAFAREFQLSTLARDTAPEIVETMVGETLKVPARVWRATFRSFLDTPDFSHELSAVQAPALIVWGDRDGFSPREDQEVLRDLIRGARLLVYEGAGHGFHWEDPGRFARDLVDFIDESLSPRVPDS